jgi:hypothetical protein
MLKFMYDLKADVNQFKRCSMMPTSPAFEKGQGVLKRLWNKKRQLAAKINKVI